MATDICTKRLTKELRNLMKHPMTDPKITVAAQDSNICEVHYVIEVPSDDTEDEAKNPLVSKVPQGGVNEATTRKKSTASATTITSPYAGGIYHGVLLFPKEYPLRPPGVKLLTKNGRFHINRRLCLSMSDFHPESWNPMWSIGTIITGLYSFMIETQRTTGSIDTSNKQKRIYAKQSLEYNVCDPTFCELFPQYVELYKRRKQQEDDAKKKAAAANTVAGVTKEETTKSSPIIIGGGHRRRNYDGDEIDGVCATIAGLVAVLSVLLAMRFM